MKQKSSRSQRNLQHPKYQNQGPAEHYEPRGVAQHGETAATQPKQGPFSATTSSQREIYEKSTNSNSCKPFSFIERQGLEMSIPGPSLSYWVEWGIMLSSLSRPPWSQEETSSVRTDQEVQNKNLPKPPLPHKRNVPTSIDTDDSPEAPLMWLPRPFSRPPQPEADLSGLTSHSASRLKPQKGGLPRPYLDPKALIPRPCKNRVSIPMGGRVRKFANKWMSITKDPCMLGTLQGNMLQFNQKASLVKPTHKCEVKFSKIQENMMTSEARSMLSEGTIELGPMNKGFFTYPSLIPRKIGKATLSWA